MARGCLRCCLVAVVVLTLLPAPSMQLNLPTVEDFLSYWSPAKVKAPAPAKPVVEESKSRNKRQVIGDSSQSPYEVESSQLPTTVVNNKRVINERYMPVLGSGIISTTVYSDSLFVNGLYNGRGANSHRASVPPIIMAKLNINDPDLERHIIRRYKFSAKNATFIEQVETPYAIVEIRTYIHQKYVRLLVVDVIARRKRGQYGQSFYFTYPNVNGTQDIAFEQPRRYEADRRVTGRIRETERPDTDRQAVFVYYNDPVVFTSVKNQDSSHNTMVMAVDIQQSAAKNDFDRARTILSRRNGGTTLFNEHLDAWKETWAMGNIEVEGDLQIAKLVTFSQFYLMTSLPPQNANQPPPHNTLYYGISRNSLGKGGKDKNYRGHIFWDNEMYLLPALVLFHPEIAKKLLHLRAAKRGEAEAYAKNTGGQGYRFPWESAVSGYDVTPDTCPTCRDNQLFVTAAVGWAIRQYFSATRDRDFMNNPDYNGCILTREIARFWVDKAVYNTSVGRYYIRNVTGPDDWHPNVDNNAFTNVMASLAIHWARYSACMCSRNERDEVPDEWIQKALHLHLPFDNVKRLHYQYEGFETKTTNLTNKQADTIMLTYPISWNMSRDIMLNDLEYYELIANEQSPAMTWSFFTVGWKWAGEYDKMRSYFLKSYTEYVQQPFKIWTEYNEDSRDSEDEESTVNYLPGMAAYLQSFIYGFAGIRIRPEFLEFHEPTPPFDCISMRFNSFNYMGADMDIDILTTKVIITVNTIGDFPLILMKNDSSAGTEPLREGSQVTVDKPELGFYIMTTEGTPCDHPLDHIFMPWGYSPWISRASSLPPPWRNLTILLGLFITLLVSAISRHQW